MCSQESVDLNPVRLIEKKRDGLAHSEEEIQFIVSAAARPVEGLMSEAQLAAWCMAVVWRGMTLDETAWLTANMARSGDRVDLTGLPKPWVDKHSTGGVGDKTTLVLLPMLAACGLTCVKMSGRGLGKTGGTIDKLESVPGFRTALSVAELKAQAGRIGLALTGQTPRLTPADGFLYALRDVTGTVRSIPLIASSVLSKKIAGGAEVISIDLKCGSGAFMGSLAEARELGQVMMGVAERLNLQLGIEITDMDQPLGQSVGNTLEVIEAIDTLRGKGRLRFRELCIELCASTLVMAKLAANDSDGRKMAEEALDSGEALQKARDWFSAQGARISPDHIHQLPIALARRTVLADVSGYAARVDAGQIGELVVDLGGGRRLKTDLIDPSVGIEVVVEVGDRLEPGRELFEVHARTEEDADMAESRLRNVIEVVNEPVPRNPVILERLTMGSSVPTPTP